MQVEIGYSDTPDSTSAGKQAAGMALSKANRNMACDLILLFCTARHNQQVLRDGVVSIVGEGIPIYGGGAAGVITNDYFGYAGDQVGLALIWLDDSRYLALTETGLAESESDTGNRLGKRLLEAGITSQSSVMLFYDAICRIQGQMRLLLATWLLEGLETGMGFLPKCMGAGLQGDHACNATSQYTGEGIEEHCAISLTFSEDIHVDNIVIHGCRPASPYYTVTKVDGPVILEINGKPALDFLDEILDSSIAQEDYPFFLLFGLNHGDPWGEYDESNYASRLCLGIDVKRGGIVMFEPDMVEGTKFQIMFRSLELDYIKPKIEQVFSRLEGREPLFAIYIDCAGRCAGYGGVDIEDAIVVQKAVGNRVPLLGIYTGAEIAPMGGQSRGLDLTGVFCLFSKEHRPNSPKKKTEPQKIWHRDPGVDRGNDKIPLDAAVELCERNAAKVLALDYKSIAIRHELEQKRRGFSLLAELSVSLKEGMSDRDLFVPVTQKINSALNMQKTVVLFPDINNTFFPYVMQGYTEEEKKILTDHPVTICQELLNQEVPVLVTAADRDDRLKELRENLGIPYFISAPVVVRNEVAAILITGRMVESAPFLSRLGRSDVETVQAVSALLASVIVYQKLDAANRQALTDGLTGLLNRSGAEMKIEEMLKSEAGHRGHYVFLIIDCDCFKEINDTYGHPEGDKVLRTLACFLADGFREEDCVSRIGGDEFVVFCKLKGEEEETEIENRVSGLIKAWKNTELITKQGVRIHSTLSMGMAFSPEDGITYDTLFKHADLALYKAKEMGRNQHAVYNREGSQT